MIKIIGTGSYVPEKVVTNDDLATMVETNDEWITQRVGIRERHVSETETTADMAIKAAKKAIEAANIDPTDIDIIVAATITGDCICPTVAGYVQQAIGAKCPAFDVSSACSGFLFALETAVSFICRGYKRALVIGAERLSKIVDWTDRSTCVIFADGAGAAIIEEGDGYLASKIATIGGDKVIKIPAHVGISPFYKNEGEKLGIFMDGQETFKFAVSTISNELRGVVEAAGLTPDDVDHVVLHQANMRIIEYAAKRLKMPIEKFMVNIAKYGNTSSASVPIALDELVRSGKIKRGDILVMCAFGGGLSSAACVIKY